MPVITATWLTWALALIVAGLLLSSIVKRLKFLYALRRIPSPQALPVFGNALQLNCSLEDFFKKLCRWSEELGDIYLLWVGSRPFIFLYRVEVVQPLLSSSQHIDKSLEYQFLKPWLGNGLITSSGEKWHSRRKMLTPTFHSDLLKDYFRVSLSEAQAFVTCLRSEVGKREFNIIPYAKRAALDVISECAMGYNLNAQTMYNNEYVQAVDRLAAISQIRFTNIWISFDFIFKRTALGKEHDKCLKIAHSLVDKIIAERKLEWRAKNPGNHNPSQRRVRTLLDLLLEMSLNGETLSDEDLREEVNTFMFAGHDTVGTSVSWALYLLGRHQQYQDKILKEAEELIGNSQPTYESIQKLTWLDACVKETLRLYPVAPLIARQIYSPLALENIEIPAGSTVLVNSYLLHRDPRFFVKPNKYKPERFLPNHPKYPSFAYVPFSAGSRNCIGSKFALMETKVNLLCLLRAYKFRALDSEDKLRLVSQLVLDNVGGIRLSITPRGSLR